MAVCVSMNRVTKRYGGKVAVNQLSLELETGEVMGLLGPNGAGKSTTLAMLAGLVRPDEGVISLFGRDIARHWLDIAPRIGVLVERPTFFENLTVRQNIRLHARLAALETSLDRVLDLAGLLHAGGTKARVLSQGMRQRLGLALALMTEPRLLLLDEPTAGLDAESAAEVLQWLRRIAEEAKVTILFSTHQMLEVERLCDRVAVLEAGSLLAVEDARDIVAYDTRQVEVLVEGAENVARRLLEQPWVEEAVAVRGRVKVRLSDGNVAGLTAFLGAGGFQVGGIVPRRRTLQEYFLKLGNRAGEAAGEEAP